INGVLAAQVGVDIAVHIDVVQGMGFSVPEATGNDMVVALRLTSSDRIEAALAAVDRAIEASRRQPSGAAGEVTEPPRTTGRGLSITRAGLALVSVPGPSATVEAMDALEAGQDVMLSSDDVPLAEEVALKNYAAKQDLLVMGPDCGTAVVEG